MNTITLALFMIAIGFCLGNAFQCWIRNRFPDDKED
jgi:hypothetical protein